MRIAVDLTPIRPDGSAGGATGVAIELLKAIVNQKRANLILLCADWNKEYLHNIFGNKVEYKLVITNKEQARKNILCRAFNKFVVRPLKGIGNDCYKADLLFCPFSAVNYRQRNIPVVSTIHDIQHEFYPQFFSGEELVHRRNFYKNIVKNADRAICVSDYTKKTFCECYGYEEDKAVTVYNAIQERFVKADDSVLERLDILAQEYIVFPANFWEHKNHKLLLNAFGMYANECKEGKLVLTGNVLGQEEYYNQLIEAMKLKGRVVIAGYLKEEELYAILKNSKGLIYPSLFEGFGIPLVEAMQMNKLVASSNLTSLPEVGCESIYYFNPKMPDEILSGIKFLFNTDMTVAIEKDYKEQLKKYTVSKMMEEYLQVFAEAIEAGVDEKECVEISGAYGDGWTGKEMKLHLVKHAGDVVRITYRVPEALESKVKITIISKGNKENIVYTCNELNELSKVIVGDMEDITISLSSTWNPSKLAGSTDCRELGIFIENIELITREETRKITLV